MARVFRLADNKAMVPGLRTALGHLSQRHGDIIQVCVGRETDRERWLKERWLRERERGVLHAKDNAGAAAVAAAAAVEGHPCAHAAGQEAAAHV
jgi:hypothetical protein